MHKIVKPEERCETCNRINKYAEEEHFCDTCEVRLTDKMDNYRGYPFSFHSVGCGDRESGNKEFCSIKCGIEWLTTKGAKYLKEHREERDRGFFSLYLFEDDVKYLAKVIKK